MAAMVLWMQTGWEAPLAGFPLLFADGAGIGGVSLMVVPCFLVLFGSLVSSEAFASVVDSGLPSSGTALVSTSVAVGAPIGQGLGCVFGIISDMLSDGSAAMVSSLAFLLTLVLALVVL